MSRRLRRALLLPGLLWLGALALAPLAIVLGYSVLTRGPYGGVVAGFTVEPWLRLLQPLYLGILARTVGLALATTALTLVIGYPMAYVIARSGRWRTALLFLVVLPFWTSYLVRMYAMIFLLRDGGLINEVLLRLGLVSHPLTLLYTPGAVLAGQVYGYLPFAVLPIYASLEKLDPSLEEAAEVLGARPTARFWRVTLPLSLPGVAAGALLVLVPALGSFLTPDLLGGARTVLLGNLIQNQFTVARDWPFGAAASALLLAAVLAGVLVHLRRRDAAEGLPLP